MQQALQLAQRGLGHTYPNPAVGCVIVKDGKVGLLAGPVYCACLLLYCSACTYSSADLASHDQPVIICNNLSGLLL